MAALFPQLKIPGEKTLTKGLIECARSLKQQLFPRSPKVFLITKIVYNVSEIVNERPFEESKSISHFRFTRQCLKVEP
jgi:hypothetical protein